MTIDALPVGSDRFELMSEKRSKSSEAGKSVATDDSVQVDRSDDLRSLAATEPTLAVRIEEDTGVTPIDNAVEMPGKLRALLETSTGERTACKRGAVIGVDATRYDNNRRAVVTAGPVTIALATVPLVLPSWDDNVGTAMARISAFGLWASFVIDLGLLVNGATDDEIGPEPTVYKRQT